MQPRLSKEHLCEEKTAAPCPVFGTCGGCSYQDLPYGQELEVKAAGLKKILGNTLGLAEEVFHSIVPSPKDYHYRHRLDIALKRSRGNVLFGFQSAVTKQMVEIENCPIAMESIAEYIPRLREESLARLPENYRTANLVLRTGDDGRVFWGGIGRHSLVMREEDYLWTEIEGRKIYYSLETFFQANLSILPAVIKKIRELVSIDKETLFLDLYSGVGLFGLCFAPEAAKVIMVEDCPGSVKLAAFNVKTHGFDHAEIRSRRMEDELSVLQEQSHSKTIAMIDPPRAGLSPQAAEAVASARYLESLLYLSCHPESLARDLKLFKDKKWKIQAVVPFDFFPRTHHLETLVLLKP